MRKMLGFVVTLDPTGETQFLSIYESASLSAACSEPPRFEKAEVAGAVEDDVVEQCDAEIFAGCFELAGDLDVGGDGSRLPAG